MKLLKNDGNYMELYPTSYEQNILINYEHVPTTSSKWRSIDRGVQSDRYETVLTFKGSQEYISDILFEINELRKANKPLILSEFDEHYFGEHIDYTNPLSTVVFDMEKQSNISWKMQTFTVKLLLNNPVFLGDIGYPFPLKCVSHQWEGYNTWNKTISETYYRDVYFTDMECDQYTFTGKFILNNIALTKFYNWYRTIVRGNELSINDSDFGVNNMFGATISATSHEVIITSLRYERISPLLKLVTIELRRIND